MQAKQFWLPYLTEMLSNFGIFGTIESLLQNGDMLFKPEVDMASIGWSQLSKFQLSSVCSSKFVHAKHFWIPYLTEILGSVGIFGIIESPSVNVDMLWKPEVHMASTEVSWANFDFHQFEQICDANGL